MLESNGKVGKERGGGDCLRVMEGKEGKGGDCLELKEGREQI